MHGICTEEIPIPLVVLFLQTHRPIMTAATMDVSVRAPNKPTIAESTGTAKSFTVVSAFGAST